MKPIFNAKNLELLFWCLYLPLGLWACIHSGISWDEGIELNTYRVNVAAIKGLLSGDTTPYYSLLNYGDRYYGIGFHIFANLLSSIIEIFLPTSTLTETESNRLTLNHAAIFICFAGSGLLIQQILKSLTQDSLNSKIGMMGYLLWPYLLGHGYMNIKDIPFLFAWLLCTDQLLKIVGTSKKKEVIGSLIRLGVYTGWLISIRISGVLIFFEYIVFAIFFYSSLGEKVTIRAAGIFVVTTCLTLFILYPILWHDPLEILNSISYMSRHPWNGDTLTAERFISGTELRWYVISWLKVKLPLIVIIGLLVFPYVIFIKICQKKSMQHQSNYKNTQFSARVISALVCSLMLIFTVLIVKNASLYNELRQILFIFPILWIIGISCLELISRRTTTTLLIGTIIVFIFDNIILYPYQYVYFNEISRLFSIANKYEKDYMGLSANRGAIWINNNYEESRGECLYASPLHLWQYAVNPTKMSCVKDFSVRPKIDYQNNNDNSNQSKYLIGVLTRDKVNQLPIPNCERLHSEERTLPLSSLTLVMGELYLCRK